MGSIRADEDAGEWVLVPAGRGSPGAEVLIHPAGPPGPRVAAGADAAAADAETEDAGAAAAGAEEEAAAPSASVAAPSAAIAPVATPISSWPSGHARVDWETLYAVSKSGLAEEWWLGREESPLVRYWQETLAQIGPGPGAGSGVGVPARPAHGR